MAIGRPDNRPAVLNNIQRDWKSLFSADLDCYANLMDVEESCMVPQCRMVKLEGRYLEKGKGKRMAEVFNPYPDYASAEYRAHGPGEYDSAVQTPCNGR